jgi:thiol-disulfide isomerase/thioredoxin
MEPVQSPDSVNLRRRRWLLGLGLPLAVGLGALAYLEFSRVPATAAAGALPLVMRTQPIPLPELRVLDGAGRPVELASLKGKVVLLNIWATWCPPCRQEMPSLDRLQAQLGGADFQVVALSMDTGAKGLELVKSFYASEGIRHLAIYQDAEANAIFKLKAVGVPTTLLLDRQGREIGRMSGTAEWDAPKIVDALKALMRAGPG